MHEPVRGPSADDPQEQLTHLSRLIAEAAARATVDIRYQESGGDKRLLQWLVGLATTLLATAIVGGIVAYGSIHDLKSTLDTWRADTEKRLDRIENRLDGRSGIARGSSDAH